MDLLATYQNEFLALLAIIIVIFIYIFVKKNQKTNEEKRIEAELAEKKSTNFPLRKENNLEKTNEENLELEGTEEGEFTTSNTNPANSKKALKKNIPAHGKITKKDFQDFAGERILVAEDNIINQKVILGLLAESGIEIVIANDGIEVLEILEQDSNFKLILMDAHMPRMDGFEATQKIRSNPNYNHIVIIALSGDTAADDIKKMYKAGMEEHLEKPLRIDSLYDIFYTYILPTNPTKQEKKETFDELLIDKGLEISGNDIIFYNEILHEFLESYSHIYKTIEKLLKQNDMNTVDKLLLDISGVAANIGALNLNKSTLNLKNALKNNNQHSKLLLDFKEKLETLVQEIKQYLSA